ncbi:MAG: hypothetical protein CMJ24_11230 [Phycisphaerae bacterium]|nr:hypothetical protein [Phycisphaerae bacterium]
MTNRDQQDWYERLLANFTSQEQIHARMLEAIDESEDALRTGRMEQFVESCRRQQSCALSMQRLESDRLELIRGCGGGAADRNGIDTIIDGAPEELGVRIRETIDRLKPLVRQTRMRCAVIRNAVGSLSRHMGGLMQGVHGVLGRPGTYGRMGTMARENQLEFNVDLQS